MSGIKPADPLSVAIVVPALNEARTITASLQRLGRDFPDCELVVVDGGSSDATVSLAARHARVVHAAAGRAVQMNTGAAATSAPVLWFVHADCRIDPCALGQIRASLADPRIVGGGLSLRFDRRSVGLDYLAWSSTIRARRLHQVFGDQAMFVRRDVFDELGSFPELPIMEDLELSRRLARLGGLVVLPATSTASARRFDEHGTWSMIVVMQALKTSYFLGVEPERLNRLYRAGPPWPRRRRLTRPEIPATETPRRDRSDAVQLRRRPEATPPEAVASHRVLASDEIR